MSRARTKLKLSLAGRRVNATKTEKEPLTYHNKNKDITTVSDETNDMKANKWYCPISTSWLLSGWSKRPESEVDIGEIHLSARERKAHEKLDKMAEQFRLSKERCQCRIEAVTRQIKSIPRLEINRDRIIILLKRRQQLTKQLNKIETAAASIEEYKHMVQDANVNKDIMSTVVELKNIVKTATRASLGSSADKAARKAGDAVDSLEEIKDDMNGISDALSNLGLGMSGNDLYDGLDDELRLEIDSWNEDGFDLFEKGATPSLDALPKLPSFKNKPSTIVNDNSDDDDPSSSVMISV